MTVAPDGRSLVGDVVRLDRLQESDVVRLVADGTVVGTSSLADVDVANERVHLG
ncbi:hypothetical protein ACWF0M_17190 [Kribbella sp. NPDC055110]